MTSRRVIMVVGAGVVLLGGALAFGAAVPGMFDAADQRSGAAAIAVETNDPPAAAAPAPAGNPLWNVALKDLPATRERPLFSASRRPPPPPPVEAPLHTASVSKPAEPDRPRLTLLGTIAGGGEGFGIFLDPSGNKSVQLRLGQSHDGWTLRQVRRRETVFDKGDETVVLALPAAGAPASAPTSAANRVVSDASADQP